MGKYVYGLEFQFDVHFVRGKKLQINVQFKGSKRTQKIQVVKQNILKDYTLCYTGWLF